MTFEIRKMKLENVIEISNWKYEEPYSLYNIDDSEDTKKEFLGGSYFSVFDDNGQLVGYCSFGIASQVPAGNEFEVYNNDEFLDIGFGLKPDLCGKKLGIVFISHILDFAKNEYNIIKYRLTVAHFNIRAIKAYKNLNFRKKTSFLRQRDNENMEFYVMIRE